MKRALLLAVPLASLACAAVIGASFDDAGLTPPDAQAEAALDVQIVDVVQEEAAPAFNPASLPSLALWLDANLGVDVETTDTQANVVTRWHDRSTHARDAVPAAASSGASAPTLVPGAFGGKSALRFAAADLDLLVVPWGGDAGAPDTTEITLFFVARGYTNSVLRFQAAVNTFPFIIFPIDFVQNKAAPRFMFDVGTPGQTFTYLQTLLDGSAAVATATFRSDGTMATFRDSVLIEQEIATPPTLPGGLTLFIGGVLPLLVAPYTSTPFADCDVAEALVFTTALSDLDRTSVEGYLRGKWGL